MADNRIAALIPHRPPFLWVDKISEWSENFICTEKYLKKDLDVFKGHYPHHPVMPGVLLCEAVFQSGALLIALLQKQNTTDYKGKLPVLTRIISAKFKRQVLPGETIKISVNLVETISTACFFKGTIKVEGKTALKTEFSCALVSS